MEEKTLFLIAALCAVIGITCLEVTAHYAEFPHVKMLEGYEEQRVEFRGEVVQVQQRGSIQVLSVQRTVPVIDFSQTFVDEGEFVFVEGTVEVYEGKHELLADTIVRAPHQE